jgi:RimJ/RimL family protein N-acetyltransferase
MQTAKQVPQLYTRRLIIKGLQIEDLPAIARLANERDIARFTSSFRFPCSVFHERQRLERILKQGRSSPGDGSAVFLRSNPTLLVGMVNVSQSRKTGLWGLGYWMARQYRGRGYVQEAARAVIRAAFEAGAPEIYADAVPTNAASLRIIRRLGFKRAGVRMSPSRYYGFKRVVIRHVLMHEEFAKRATTLTQPTAVIAALRRN